MGNQMSLENLDEYILEYQNYKEGNYEYGSLRSSSDIIKAIENGKKIIFIEGRIEAKVCVVLGSIFLILGLLLAIFTLDLFLDFWIFSFSLFFGLFGGLGIVFIVIGLFKMRASFLAIGPEGIVYKLRGRRIQGYKWEELSVDFQGIRVTMISAGIHVLMPNGDFIIFSVGDYRSEEFPKLKSYRSWSLYKFAFMSYYIYGMQEKLELQENNTAVDVQNITKDFTNAESTNINNGNLIDILRKEYHKYKEKMYKFGKYGTKYQIHNEFLQGKVFILKGGLRGIDWTIFSIILAMGLIMGISLSLFYIGLGVFMFCFWASFASIFFIKLRNLVVVSPLGVFYRKILSSGVFSWQDVANVKGIVRTYRGSSWTVVTIYLSPYTKIKLASRAYLNKEFPKKIEKEMFFALFYIYFKLGQDKIMQSPIQKTVTFSQLREEISSAKPKTSISQFKVEEAPAILSHSDQTEEKPTITAENQSQQFKPISELLKEIYDEKEEDIKRSSYTCKFCGKELIEKTNFCPQCGEPINKSMI